ncbi:MAG: hypothetical protein KC777_15220 [Cyanobacteria bacterium HKST-UBA02]|nr:hypothetical protein [Cyanobacteria bacterium HKST-UBA02]
MSKREQPMRLLNSLIVSVVVLFVSWKWLPACSEDNTPPLSMRGVTVELNVTPDGDLKVRAANSNSIEVHVICYVNYSSLANGQRQQREPYRFDGWLDAGQSKDLTGTAMGDHPQFGSWGELKVQTRAEWTKENF